MCILEVHFCIVINPCRYVCNGNLCVGVNNLCTVICVYSIPHVLTHIPNMIKPSCLIKLVIHELAYFHPNLSQCLYVSQISFVDKSMRMKKFLVYISDVLPFQLIIVHAKFRLAPVTSNAPWFLDYICFLYPFF